MFSLGSLESIDDGDEGTNPSIATCLSGTPPLPPRGETGYKTEILRKALQLAVQIARRPEVAETGRRGQSYLFASVVDYGR